MGTVPGSLGGYQPVCDDCGIALCYEIDEWEYELHQSYWDSWKCQDCDPDYLANWRKAYRQQHKENQNGL